MKKIFFFAAAVAVSLSISAQKQMHVWMNGSPLRLALSKVDSVTFFDPNASTPDIPEPDPNPDPSTANGIGIFSVAEGKTVSFAPGNLQFNAVQGSHLRADGTTAKGTWRFAENQWDYVGEANENIAEDYDGWIDLFGWGTSGYDNTKNDPLAMFYQPWSVYEMDLSSMKKDSTLNCDVYEITGECIWEYTYWDGSCNEYGFGPSTSGLDFEHLINSSENYDWGIYNAISNGGNAAGLWRTLRRDEWEYLLNKRKNAQYLHSAATVNGVPGYIILPDNFKKPAGISWSYQTSDWITNSYSLEQWIALEKIGAIFLPASGSRFTKVIHWDMLRGDYWSATASWMHLSSLAYRLSFTENYIAMSDTDDGSGRANGYSVRLVKDL